MEIKSSIVNQYSWNSLSCFERIFSIACETLYEGSHTAFLLLKALHRDCFSRNCSIAIGDNEYYDKLLSDIGIISEKKTSSIMELNNVIDKTNKDNAVMICCINTIMQPGAKGYLNKNHPHYLIVYDYDGVQYKVIDEKWENEYWKTVNYEEEIIYEQRLIEKEQFCNLLLSYKACSEDNMLQENYFSYYVLTKKGSSKNIYKLYYKQLKSIVAYGRKYIEDVMQALDVFYDRINDIGVLTNQEVEERSNSKKNFIKSDDINRIRNRYIYPYESEIVACHHYFVEAQYQFFNTESQVLCDNPDIKLCFEDLLRLFETIRLLIAKNVMRCHDQRVYVKELVTKAIQKELYIYELIIKLSTEACYEKD